MQYHFNVEGDELNSGALEQMISIPAKGYSDFTIPANVSLMEAVETMFDSWFRAGRTEYSLYLKTIIVSENRSVNNSKLILEATGNLRDLKEARKTEAR
jgi:hypothetical protein